jgi:hypothetical protein
MSVVIFSWYRAAGSVMTSELFLAVDIMTDLAMSKIYLVPAKELGYSLLLHLQGGSGAS